MSSNRNPPLAEVLNTNIAAALANMHTMIPAVVTAYDPSIQAVSVQPLVKRISYSPDGAKVVTSLPVQANIPVHFMAAGGFALTCDITTTTTGMLVVSEASLDVWKSGAGQEVDPNFNERFQLKDAVFVPGLNPFGAPLAGLQAVHDAGEMFAGVPGALGIHWTPALITIGDKTGSKPIALNGDAVDCGSILSATVMGALQVSYQPPGGAPIPIFTVAAGTPIVASQAITGKVAASATQAKAH